MKKEDNNHYNLFINATFVFPFKNIPKAIITTINANIIRFDNSQYGDSNIRTPSTLCIINDNPSLPKCDAIIQSGEDFFNSSIGVNK